MKKRIVVIGSGFSGLSAASYLVKAGNEVQVFEKQENRGNEQGNFLPDQDLFVIRNLLS